MPISRSVGRTAQNDLTDVLLVQIIFNMNTGPVPQSEAAAAQDPTAASGQAPSVPSNSSRRW